MNFNLLEITRKDLILLGIMIILWIITYLVSHSFIVLMNGIVSFIFTFIPARIERIKMKNDVKGL